MKVVNLKSKSLNQSGNTHIVVALLIIVVVAVVGVYMLVASHADPFSASARNPYTAQCPGNRVTYGVPNGKTATAAARSTVFGPPYPNANVAETTFMGHTVYMNRKVIPCLKAVEWDLQVVYHTNYKVQEVFGASELNSQNPPNFFHAYGAAIDINPTENPQCVGGCNHCSSGCRHDMPAQWVRAFRAHGFFWGGNFRTDKDFMHFEWHGQRP